MDQNLSTLTKIGNWISTLLLGNTRELIIRIDERVNHLMDDMKDVKSTLAEHGRMLATHTEILREHGEDIAALKMYVGYNVRHSPNIPSEKGRKLLKESGFDDIYPRVREKIFTLIEKKNPKTLYDYEKEAERALRSLRDDPIIYRLKDYVVEHEDQPLVLIFEIASWVVRDDYLREHPLPLRPR